MARPSKARRVCQLPVVSEFAPVIGCAPVCEAVVLTVDEYASVYMIDYQGMTQQECAGQMQVSRTTVQGIYATARRKVATSIVEGRRLVISGGEYRVCHEDHKGCCRTKKCDCKSRSTTKAN